LSSAAKKSIAPTLTLHQTMHPQQTKPPAATAAPLTAIAMEDDKGFSTFVSYTPDQRCERYNGPATCPKNNQQSTIKKQRGQRG
jgi:hypothetical protein